MSGSITTELFAEVKSRKMLLKELSYHSGIARPLLSAYKTGKNDMGLKRAERLAKALGYRLTLQPIGE